MPENEWCKYTRISRIFSHGQQIDHPFEANIWQFSDKELQEEYLDSIRNAGCNTGEPKPVDFISWIYWKLGNKIAEDYMIPYNQKMFGENLNQLGTYWLEKLPNVSYEETLQSCNEHKPYGKEPGHSEFYYPKKYGYGELWLRMAKAIEPNIKYNTVIDSINFKTTSIKTNDGQIFKADVIITTIPWLEFKTIEGMPQEMIDDIKKLKYTSLQTEYFPNKLDTNAHWVYVPNPDIKYHRMLVRHNFCPNSKGYWTETNVDRLDSNFESNNPKFINKYAYPLNTIEKPQILNELLKWSESKNVIGLGRWGEHQHYNSDVTVDLSLKMADRLISK